MNRSTVFFEYKPITRYKDQSNGEPDFADSTRKKYDAKLLINKNQGKKLGQDINKDIIGFFNEIMGELTEFGDKMKRDRSLSIEETKFYKIAKERVESCKMDENIILFIPFPISFDMVGSVFLERATDSAQAVYEKLKENGLIAGREFYYVYPLRDGIHFAIRNAETRDRDYIPMPQYQEALSFELIDTKN